MRSCLNNQCVYFTLKNESVLKQLCGSFHAVAFVLPMHYLCVHFFYQSM